MALLTYFSNYTKRSMREKFERFQQISDLLNIEEIDHIIDLKQEWESTGTCQLTNTDIQKIISLRSDLKFKPSDLTHILLK